MSGIPHTNITRMVVKNYRSLADVDIALHPLTVLVGENGSGKSNTLDVLRFVRDVMTDGFELALFKRGRADEVRCWEASPMEEIRIHLYFEGPSFKGDYSLAFGASLSNLDQCLKSERLFLTAPGKEDMLLEAVDGKLVRYPEQLGVMPMGHPFNEYHAKPRYQTTPFLSQLAIFSERIEAVRHFLASMNFYDISPERLRSPQKAHLPFPLREDGANLATTLRELKRGDVASQIVSALEVAVRGFRDYSVEQTGSFGSLATKLHYQVNGRCRTTDLCHEADGMIRFLAILTALYQNRALSPLTIEEPEKAIFPRALGLCSDVLEEAAISYQVLVTTHSTDLIDQFPVDSFLVVEKEDGLTQIGPIIENQRHSVAKKWFSLGEMMQMEGLQREKEEEKQLCLP
jgi:predicted ATPase